MTDKKAQTSKTNRRANVKKLKKAGFSPVWQKQNDYTYILKGWRKNGRIYKEKTAIDMAEKQNFTL